MPKINTLVSKGIMERRMIGEVRVAAFIVDYLEGAITFPNTEDEVDMSTLFIVEDYNFCEWCSDYFDYMWRDSKPFDVKKVKVVEY